ncbi:hypothetical protein ABES25_09310 [Bacillus gobiensis]|uniref:hypothetical protein n=1 Tax=Bacillus gobiensis TaxID=1441095 RepID=UPI003D1A4955
MDVLYGLPNGYWLYPYPAYPRDTGYGYALIVVLLVVLLVIGGGFWFYGYK